MKASKLIALSLLCLGLSSLRPCAAEGYYQSGVSYYLQGDYKRAGLAFEAAVASGSKDSRCYYYSAVCFSQLKDYARARARYQQTLKLFPNTEAARNSALALGLASHPAGTASGSPANRRGEHIRGAAPDNAESDNASLPSWVKLTDSLDLSQCPTTSKIYFTSRDDGTRVRPIVKVSLNNRPMEMLFDTGASTILLGKNHLRELGMAVPADWQKPSGYGSGVGSSGVQPYWTVYADLRMGSIFIPKCPIDVQEYLPTEPLLGETVFKHFAYTFDYGAKSIVMTKKDSGRTAGATAAAVTVSRYAVPFVREGNEMVVDAEVNGKPMKMYFDTGATTVAFSMRDLASLGMNIPEDAEAGYSQGVAGTSRAWFFPVQRMKVGPVEKNNMPIHVIEHSNMGHPLLGQEFYAGWQYTIDNDKMVINFLRR